MYRMAPANQEIKDMLIADAVLTVAFSILLGGGLGRAQGCTASSGIMSLLCSSSFLFFLPIAFVAVSFSFILHEYMHKRVAQHYGAIAAFKKSNIGIAITILTSLFGFLMGLPGATMIYTDTFTKKQDGITSLAGPLTNFAVFAVFFAASFVVPSGSYIASMVGTTMFIALWIAFFNMLPIYPLDGSKVLRWNKPVYAFTLVVLFLLLYYVTGPAILSSIFLVFILALVMSFFSRGILFR